ncbi:Phosphoglycerate mutase (2,3-diphosphoglycerate-dependent) [Bertholletia excelsa]
MALSIHRDLAALHVQQFGYCFRTYDELGNFHMKLLFSNGLWAKESLPRRGTSGSCQFKFSRMKATTTHCTAIDPVLSSTDSSYMITGQSEQMPEESTLILIRHGESLWNEKNLFSGCVDVPLTNKGVEEAIEAGKRIRNIPLDIIFTSALARAQMTAMLAMTQHRSKKVPVVRHDENEHAKIWSQIHSEDTEKQSIPVVKAWQLNERMYGELQGFNKQETAERYGKVQVHEWRRSYDTCPPNGESLEMCSRRAVVYFREHIEPQLLSGKHVMVAAHANSLRAIIMYLDGLTSEEEGKSSRINRGWCICLYTGFGPLQAQIR